MFWIVETTNQIKKLSTKGYKEAYLDIIPLCPYTHSVKNQISLIYLRPLDMSRGYIISINHNESLPIKNWELVKFLLNTFDFLYVKDKKDTLHYIDLPNLIDIGFNGKLKSPPNTQAHKYFYRQTEFKYINKLIPLSKHYELCEEEYQNNLHLLTPEVNEFLNETSTRVFNQIEKNGLYIDPQIFNQYFYQTKDNIVYTQYNIKTTTTRPANSYNSVNYMALDKKNGCRKAFIPRNNYLLELDIKSYHPSIIATLINYDFKNKNPHEYLAELYGVEYNESKLITFRQIYGGISNEYKNTPFFSQTQEYINKMWEFFSSKGYIEIPISKYKIYQKDHPNIKKQTLFNYLLQGLETSQNVEIMEQILNVLGDSNTKLIHYTYDSFLFDVDANEIKELLKLISPLFKDRKLKVSFKAGESYDF